MGIFFICVLAWFGLQHIWLSGTASGYVIDENNKPVEGAIVMASWRLHGSFKESSFSTLMLQEAKTDSDGRFKIDGWGPIFSAHGYMNKRDPILYVIGDGYFPEIVNANDWPVNLEHRMLFATPEPNTLQVRMRRPPPAEGDLNQDTVEGYLGLLVTYEYSSKNCVWNDVPQFLHALRVIEVTFNARHKHFAHEICDRIK